jgi:hypothetical protein
MNWFDLRGKQVLAAQEPRGRFLFFLVRLKAVRDPLELRHVLEAAGRSLR